MKFSWMNYRIHLGKMYKALKNTEGFDGITADGDGFEIMVKSGFNIDSEVSAYIESINENSELEEFHKEEKIIAAKNKCIESIALLENITDMDKIQRKIFMGIPLTEEEEEEMVILYGL